MSSDFMSKLTALREKCNFPFIITSAFRCEKHNEKIGGATKSAHIYGRAVDISVKHKDAMIILTHATKYGMTGIGVSQKGNGRFIHLDDYHHHIKLWSY